MILDLGREEVVEYLIGVLSELLNRYDIDFFKWDMNRDASAPGSGGNSRSESTGSSSGSAGGGGSGTGMTPQPSGRAEGRDDDIVARQLREAAETETNPALREKLWEEYRAYKNARLKRPAGPR